MRKKLFVITAFTIYLPTAIIAQVTQEWVRKFVGSGVDNAAAIAADNSGNIYILGNNNWGLSTSDIYLVRYNSSGLQTGGILYNSPYNNSDVAKALAIDLEGNVYVAGRVSVDASTTDVVVIKYNSSMTQQWATIFNTPENYADDVNAMKVDAAGNVYLTGSIVKGPFEYDYLTVKLNSSGGVLWHATYNGTANGLDIANSIAIDGAGNVFVTGLSVGLSGIRSRLGFFGTSSEDIATIKYDANGVQQWVQRYNRANGNDAGNAIALDATGNVFVTGNSAANGNIDCATLKYSNDGVLQWVQLYDGMNGNDIAQGLAIDFSGNVIIAGSTTNASGNWDILVVKYNTDGGMQWVGTYGAASNTADQGQAIKLDQFGDIYVAGQTSVPGMVSSDFLTVKFSSTGTLAWTARYNGPENAGDNATSLAVVDASSIGALQSSTIYVFGASNNDVVTIKYKQAAIVQPPPVLLERKNNMLEEKTSLTFKSYAIPNPVKSTIANIYYELPHDGDVQIILYDEMGRKIIVIANGFRNAGKHTEMLDVSALRNGEYYYRFIVKSMQDQFSLTKKLILQK